MSYSNRTNLRQTLLILAVFCFFVTLIFLNYVFFSTRVFMYEQSSENRLSPMPGKFLWSFPMNNESYCNFNYGLPDKLNYSENDLKYPPQEGFNSSYRVLYNIIQGNYDEDVPNVTYVTHITLEFSLFIAEIVRYWDGPVSIAAFLPLQDAQIFFQKIYQICLCLPQMSRVSIHLVFPVNYEPYHDETTNFSTNFQNCNVKNEFLGKLNRINEKLFYPINVGRNIARKASNTNFVMVSDIELIPSKNLAKNFIKFTKVFKYFESHQVFVVPIFEVDYGFEMPLDKRDLINSFKLGIAVCFHKFVCPHCQKFPGIDAWLGKYNGNKIRAFLSVKREYPFHRWEPIFIGTKQDPLYDELLSWEGLQDKMTQMLKMCLLNYKFVILDEAFLIHWPGIKRKTQKDNDGWRIPYIRKNSEKYSKIIDNIINSPGYKENRKCKIK